MKKTIIIAVLVAVAGFLVYKFMPETLKISKPKVIGAVYLRQHIEAYEGFKKGIKELGYNDKKVEFDEFLIIPGPTFFEDVEAGIKKMIQDEVDVLFVSMEHQAETALKLTKEAGVDMPIVFMTRFHDPLDYGIIKSYKSSGNNATGIATDIPRTTQRTLSFFKEINPKTKKIAVFGQGFMIPGFGDLILSELKKQGPNLGLTIVEYTTTATPPDAEKAWHEIANKIKPGEIDGLVHIAGHFFGPQEHAESELAIRLGIPMAAPSEDLLPLGEGLPSGGTFSFSDDFGASAKQAAVMIDKIFKGAMPSEIPIEFGTKDKLILHLARAKKAGFAFPGSMLSIAEEKVETE